MGFIEQYFKDRKEIEPEDIELFVSRKIEENINLDYKHITAYQHADDLAIHASSFANSEGGLIALGVSQNEVKDERGKTIKIYPKKVTWGKVSLDKESLEQKLMTRIKPPINGMVIAPIRNEENKVIFFIDIPKSSLAPHMVSYKYHRRTNFGTRPMEHYEIDNLFRINWTMKEKLVEKIYEPLSSVLGDHTKQLSKYSCPNSYDFEKILSNTYYKTQMPFALLERLFHYIELIDDLSKKEHYARRAMDNIVQRNVFRHLEKKFGASKMKQSLDLDFRAHSKDSSVQLYIQEIYTLLLTGQNIQAYYNETYYRRVYETMEIRISNDKHLMNLGEFDESIWKKCLREVSKNTKIIQMKKSAEALLKEALELIEEITRY